MSGVGGVPPCWGRPGPVLGVWRGEGLRLAYVLDTGMRFICARIKLRIKRMV